MSCNPATPKTMYKKARVFQRAPIEKQKESLPDEGVDLESGNIVHLLQGILDLALVGLDVNEEDQGVVLLNLLHGRLGVEGSLQDLVLIQTGNVGNRLAGVLGVTGKLQGLGAVEGGRGADLASLLTVDALQGSLLGSESLVLIRRNGYFFEHARRIERERKKESDGAHSLLSFRRDG